MILDPQFMMANMKGPDYIIGNAIKIRVLYCDFMSSFSTDYGAVKPIESFDEKLWKKFNSKKTFIESSPKMFVNEKKPNERI